MLAYIWRVGGKHDDDIYKKLRVQAARRGASMEEEARRILTLAVSTPDSITAVFKKHFGDKNGVDLVIPNSREPHEPMDFQE